MTKLRQRMTEDMQLRGLSEKTQESYLRAVRQLAEYYHKTPDQICEEELRQYFLYLKNIRRVSHSSCTIALCGIKFFYERTLRRAWPTLKLVLRSRRGCMKRRMVHKLERFKLAMLVRGWALPSAALIW